MSDTYTANDDGSYSVVSEDELSFIEFGNTNPSTGAIWLNEEDVKSFVAAYPNVWTLYSSMPTQEEQDAMTASNNRMKRNELLASSDWTQANDSPLAAEKKVEWATYRTALRNLPSSSDWPDVTFPTGPS